MTSSACACSCCRTRRAGSPVRSSTSTAGRSSARDSRLHRPGQHRRRDGLAAAAPRPPFPHIREESAAPFVEKGARFGSLKDLAVECDVISIVVLTDAQVRAVVGGLLERATAGAELAAPAP